jgi:serine/threonine protein kinase
MDILTQLSNHPLVIQLKKVISGSPFRTPLSPLKTQYQPNRDDDIHFVMELAHCDGHKFIRSDNINWPTFRRSFCQLMLGIESIHCHSIIHRDIKPENFLILASPEYGILTKLCDFGMGKPYTRQGPQTPRVSTTWYRAPEIAKMSFMDVTYDYKVDIWSLGCIFYEGITGEPFITIKNSNIDDDKLENREIIDEIRNSLTIKIKNIGNKIRPTFRLSITTEIAEIQRVITGMLQIDPTKRWTPAMVLKSSLFDPERNIIQSISSKSNIIVQPCPSPIYISCIERKWASEMIWEIYHERHNLSWYGHRRIFQAFDLYDRYLEKMYPIDSKVPVTDHSGRLHTIDEVQFHITVCLYISIKYFSTMSYPIRYRELVSERFQTDIYYQKAERFEKFILFDVCQQRIYRETLYEASDRCKLKLSDKDVERLLRFHMSTTKHSGFSLKDVIDYYIYLCKTKDVKLTFYND